MKEVYRIYHIDQFRFGLYRFRRYFSDAGIPVSPWGIKQIAEGTASAMLHLRKIYAVHQA